MRILVGVFLLLGSACHASAEGSAVDPRAVEDCKMTSDSFVQVSECLPTAHVAFLTLDAFETIYPSAALPLKARCLELNPKGITGASTCVVQAISAAVKLAASLPAGSTLDDPIFDAVADPALKVKLDAEIDAAQSAFPDQMMWGGGLYHPYR